MIFAPARFSADLSEVGDGPYSLTVELRGGEKPLHKVSTPLFVVHGPARLLASRSVPWGQLNCTFEPTLWMVKVTDGAVPRAAL